MADPARTFYDDLAESYHLIFQDWTQSIQRQAAVLGPLIERTIPTGTLRILDCACGIGTQSLGLAARGHALVGVDLSDAAIGRARREAWQRNLSIQYNAADMRDLSTVSESGFDLAIAIDNALPHLLNEQDLARALQQIAGKLRPGGFFLASIRDYDLYIQQETEEGWTSRHFLSVCRVLLREELTAILHQTGFVEVSWLTPSESGFYQPLVLARYAGETYPSRSMRIL